MIYNCDDKSPFQDKNLGSALRWWYEHHPESSWTSFTIYFTLEY